MFGVLCLSFKNNSKLILSLLCLTIFPNLPNTYIYNNGTNTYQMKRTCRRLSETTKQKISVSLRNKPKTEQHKQALSIALLKYWQTIPYEEK